MSRIKTLKIASIALASMLALELTTYLYVRYQRFDSGYIHGQLGPKYITHHYTFALGKAYNLNKALLYFHWPLLKTEGVIRNCRMSALHHYHFFVIHEPASDK